MRLTAVELTEIDSLLGGLDKTKEADLMKQYIQHGNISTYDHVISVVRLSFYLNRHLRLGASDPELVRGAFLHDFYLYDWHKNGYIGRLHGFHHPAIALKNAEQRYELTLAERNIIESHMWPLTLFTVPKSRAAFIVCLADKICSCGEIIMRKKEYSNKKAGGAYDGL